MPGGQFGGKQKGPYFQPLTNLLKTPSYEHYLDTVQAKLEKRGIRSDVFKSHLLHQFVVCMWTARRRKHLRKVARNYEAILVMGCEAALDTVQDSIDASFSRVFQGMRTEGIMSIKPLLHPPCDISLELNRVTPLLHDGKNDAAWVCL